MINLVIFMAVLSVLIIIHEFGHFITAKKIGVKVEKFSLGFGPTILKKKKGETEYSINAVLLGGYVKLAGDNLEEWQKKPDEFLTKKPGQRAAVIFAGPLLNYIMGIIFLWLVFFIGYPTLTTKVGGLIEGLGAKDAGIEVKDEIISVDGKKVRFWEDLQRIIQAKSNNSMVKLSVLRDSQEYSVDVKVKTKDFNDLLGIKHSIGLLGIAPDDEFIKVRHGFFESFLLSIDKTWEMTAMTYKGLWLMVTRKLSMRESVTGPLGIFHITSKAASVGIIALMHLIAVLNISLAIFNLLPLPVLDGGHIFLLIIEKIRGKALSLRVDRIVTQLGLSFIITLAVFVTYNDIVRVFGDKIIKIFK